ncbi:uncharacterized protein LOC107410258 [Ziziphus jujuba]|uniref:Uncharacterized protein LOC107410258 n=1 Tax=Ziziphus jujuba TaxID=326968 RepID=A0A6P3Z7H0_ZIZJJ|nr:uncharacterized protein LOC107410258 [Ziziphus jujuba]
MGGQVVLRSSPAIRRTPLLMVNSPTTVTPRDKRQFREVAGGTTAECAAVCCCCPCAVLDLLVTVIYRVPFGVCRKAWNRTTKRHRCAPKKGLLRRPSSPEEHHTREELEAELKRVKEAAKKEENIAAGAVAGPGAGGEVVPPETGNFSEKEMWDRFYGTGFWRSQSQRE